MFICACDKKMELVQRREGDGEGKKRRMKRDRK